MYQFFSLPYFIIHFNKIIFYFYLGSDMPNINLKPSSNINTGSGSLTTSRYSHTQPASQLERQQQANRRERILTSTSVNSNFSSHLREAIKPMRYIVSRTTVTPVTMKVNQGQPGDVSVQHGVDSNYWSMPSLRMNNEESSFTQYVRLNKSAAQRLRKNRISSQTFSAVGVTSLT